MKKKIQSKPFQTECIMRWKSKEPTVYLCIIFLLEVEIRSFAILHFQWDNSCPSPPFISGFYFGFFSHMHHGPEIFSLIHTRIPNNTLNKFSMDACNSYSHNSQWNKNIAKKAQRKMLWKHSHTPILIKKSVNWLDNGIKWTAERTNRWIKGK